MTAHRFTKWFWSDWAGDEAVRRLTPAERGLWIDLLALAAVGNPTGYVCDARGEPVAVEEIARFANCSAAEASSLISGILAKGVASRDRSGRLFNRRMLRDTELVTKRRRAGKLGGAVMALRLQGLTGLPRHVLDHVPKQTGRAPLPESKITSSFAGAARESAVRDHTASVGVAPPAGLPRVGVGIPEDSLQPDFQEKARQAVQQNSGGLASGELEAMIKAKRW